MSENIASAGDLPARSRGQLVVLAGPSAVGKSTVVRRLREDIPTLFFSVSMTTRQPRPGEQDGVDYHFVSSDEFQSAIAEGQLLEWAEIHGGLQRSGTPAAPIAAARAQDRPVLVEVDLAGARAIRKSVPDSVSVFLAPPSWEALVERLSGRGTESPEVVQRRLETARQELESRTEFDSVVVNDDLDHAVAQLTQLLLPPG